MRRFVRLALLALLAGALAALGVALARPSWLPRRVRLDPGRLRAWVVAATAPGEDDDDRPASAKPGDDDPWRVIRLDSPEVARRFGVETAPVVAGRLAHHLTANAETAYDAERSAEIIPRVAGVLREVRVGLGRVVKTGDVLAVADSAQVGAAKAKYLTARSAFELAQDTHKRTVALTQARAAPGKSEIETRAALNQAEASLLDARQALRNYGFTDADLERIAGRKETGNLLEVVAPIGGTIITWDATLGEAVEPTTVLFGLADTSRMWLWIDVYEADIPVVAVGQPVTFVISGTREPVFEGKITWMSTEVNPATRTTRVRAELPNPAGRLRANQFGTARIRVEPEHEASVIPREALQEDGADRFVFVPLDDGRSFRPQKVEVRPTDREDAVEVVAGLTPGQRVVTTRSFMLKGEMFRDRLGAADND